VTKKQKVKGDERKRKIGERTEVIEVKLTPMQIEDARAKVIDLLQEKDELEEKLASVKADYKAKIAEVDSRKAHELGMVRTGRTRKELVIEEWVTAQNEVVRVNQETGEELGRRTATPRELQEELPLEDAKPEADAESELEDEVAADGDESEDDGDEFGEKE
jgi:hypothetical protein